MKKLTMGLATLATFVALGGAAQAQIVIPIPGTGINIQTNPYNSRYVYPNYTYPSSNYYQYETTPSRYYYSTPSSSQYYYNYDYNPRTARNKYNRNSRGFPASHERQNYYYDNSGRYYYYR